MAVLDFLVPGEQEVGRGELYALVVALERLEKGAALLYVTDRKSVWQAWDRKLWRHVDEATANPDLLRRIGAKVEADGVVLCVVLTESHAEKRDIEGGYVTELMAAGNDIVDKRAEAMAARHAVPRSVAAGLRQLEEKAALLRHRMAACT
eukprot:9622573-Lingulodinium_polyedra.AAC.1